MGVLVNKFAGRRSVNTKLVFYAAHINSALTLVVNEHGKTATVARAFLRTCKHKVNVRVAVGNETFHTVEQPAAVLFGISGTEHNALQVASCIRFSKVHGHCLACANARNVFLSLLLVSEFVKSFYAVLKTPYIFKTGISGRNNLVCKSVRSDRKIKTAVSARHGHTIHSRSNSICEIFFGTLGVTNSAVLEMRTLGINALCVGSHNVCRYITHDFKHTVVAVHCVVEINRRIIVFSRIRIVAFAKSDNLFHQGVIQMELQFRLI